MKINYTDADGRILELEVSEEIGEFYLASTEAEKSNDRANTRRHTSLSTFTHEDIRFFNSGIDYVVNGTNDICASPKRFF